MLVFNALIMKWVNKGRRINIILRLYSRENFVNFLRVLRDASSFDDKIVLTLCGATLAGLLPANQSTSFGRYVLLHLA